MADATIGTRVMERNSCFGPVELGYTPDRVFMEWQTRDVQGGGWKMHVSARPEQAEIVARIVLPVLRRLGIPHKVVASLESYERLNQGNQRGKFITIYNRNQAEAEQVLEALDAELRTYRDYGGLLPGPLPTSRDADHREFEIPVGDSGFISVLYRYDYTQ